LLVRPKAGKNKRFLAKFGQIRSEHSIALKVGICI
jgi:hypothetical protein